MSQRKLFAHELTERLDALLFASPSHRSVAGLAAGLEGLNRARQDLVLHWVGVTAQTDAEIGYQVAAFASQALAVLGEPGFEAWVIAGLDRYDREGLRPAMAALRDVE
ncbi:MAG TPA: hypothetical protein VMB75_03975, partial [Rhodocyclaceae bacterium]|nr:hypothetical protein [Rhodocyclaceae bacterium]